MASKSKKAPACGPVRSGVMIDRQLWQEFKRRAKERGVTLQKAMEDALRCSLIKMQVEACIAGDGKGKEE
jgi:hypothetical protein